MSRRAYFLVGPTASGKTDIAHILARRMSLPILSIDSMQVYRGMDIGTAKPSPDERREFPYYGIDLVDPNADFSLAAFCEYVEGLLEGIEGEFIVCGGTGLYAKALTEPFNTGPAPDPTLRSELEELMRTEGVEGLRAELESIAPGTCKKLKDSENPRRLVRAIEKAKAGADMPDTWGQPSEVVFAGVSHDRDVLCERIAARTEAMFKCGLVDETKALLDKHGSLARTAAQAIGYREAVAVLGGELKLDAAVESTQTRTRQLAKKQRTWFRNQAEVEWVEAGSMTGEEIADRVAESWEKNGPVDLLPRTE